MNNYKLIKLTEGYIIVSDEDIKEGDYVYHPEVSKKYTVVDITKKGNDRYTERNHIAQGIYKHIPTTNDWYLKERKIIASTFIPELPGIDFNGFEEEFGIVSYHKLYNEDIKKYNISYSSNNSDTYLGFNLGFNKCLELNKDKLYTLEDLKDAFESGEHYGRTWSEFYNTDSVSRDLAERVKDFNGFIQSLQPKTEWDVEVEMTNWFENDYTIIMKLK